MSRLIRLLPAIAVASAVLATLAYGAYFWATLDAFFKETTRVTAHMGSFQGQPVATEEEVASADRLARLLRSAWRVLLAVFVVSTAAALWLQRAEARDWPWLSALAFVLGLGVLGFGIAFTVGVWGLPILLGVVALALSSFELALYRRRGRRPSIVTWAALGVAVSGLVANLVHPRGF